MIDTGARTDEQISLEEYIEYLDANLDVASEESLIETAPKLLALSRNRSFLADVLAAGLSEHRRFQRNNSYVGPTFVLGVGEGYMVRAVAWVPRDHVELTPEGGELSAYGDRDQVAHSHNFSFLTTCYWGDGYETELYECEPGHLDGQKGQRVELRYRGRRRLPSDRVMLYRAHRDVHIQYPTEDLSISLNLIVQDTTTNLSDQYYFSVPDGEVLEVFSPANDARIGLLDLAAVLADSSLVPNLCRIADGHPSRRVRERAAEVLQGA